MAEFIIEFDGIDGPSRTKIDQLADTCPICGKAVEAIFSRAAAATTASNYLQVVFQCPRNNCRSFFIGYYEKNHGKYWLHGIQPVRPNQQKFSAEIDKLSPGFVSIYNQAFYAEQHQLDQVCGPGYRKALEFLIKDYACSKNPSKGTEIKASFLGTCIKHYIDDARIQDCAQRAAWLGNDETHYIRKWSDKDLEDLKLLIRLTVNWIENVLLTEQYTSGMPKS